jgi:hypothetical protein
LGHEVTFESYTFSPVGKSATISHADYISDKDLDSGSIAYFWLAKHVMTSRFSDFAEQQNLPPDSQMGN